MSKILNLIKEHIQNNDESLNIYFMCDGVKVKTLYKDLKKSNLKYDILFKEDKLRDELEEIAPYIVQLDFYKEDLVEQSLKILEYYNNNSSIVIISNSDFKNKLEDLREVFYLYDENDKLNGFFRFYDSSILDMLIQTNTNEVLNMLFKNNDLCFYDDTQNDNKIKKYNINNKEVV